MEKYVAGSGFFNSASCGVYFTLWRFVPLWSCGTHFYCSRMSLTQGAHQDASLCLIHLTLKGRRHQHVSGSMWEQFGEKEGFGVGSTESPWWVTWSSSHQRGRGGKESLGLWATAVGLSSYYMLLEHCEKESVSAFHAHMQNCLWASLHGRDWLYSAVVSKQKLGIQFLGWAAPLGASWERENLSKLLSPDDASALRSVWVTDSFLKPGSSIALAVTTNLDKWTATPFLFECLVMWVLVQNRPFAIISEGQGPSGRPGRTWGVTAPPTWHKHDCHPELGCSICANSRAGFTHLTRIQAAGGCWAPTVFCRKGRVVFLISSQGEEIKRHEEPGKWAL